MKSIENLQRSGAFLGGGVNFGSCFFFRKCILGLIKENYVESNTQYTYATKTSERKKVQSFFWVV